MPHFEIKLYLGYRPEQWKALFRRVVDAAIEELGVPGGAISVAFHEVAPEHWQECVYQPLIQDRDDLVKVPKYN